MEGGFGGFYDRVIRGDDGRNIYIIRGAEMKCSICGEKIVLIPSAAERAKKYGGKPSDYIKIFREHTECALKKREADTRELMRRFAGSAS